MIADHEDTSDPHALYAASHDHYTNSQVAVLRANVLRTELVSSTIPASHTLTMHYILIFSAKVHEYNKMVEAHNLMDTAQQLTHFKNYIRSVSELNQTSNAIDILSADKALDPLVEIQMYKRYAQRVDDATARNSSRGNRRQAFESETLPIEVNKATSSTYDIGDEWFEGLSDDDPRASYEAYAAFCGMRMNRKTWDSLSQSDKEGWDNISQADKDTILRFRPLPVRYSTSTTQSDT